MKMDKEKEKRIESIRMTAVSLKGQINSLIITYGCAYDMWDEIIEYLKDR